jgi:lipid-binding SYLF domain-containing protein
MEILMTLKSLYLCLPVLFIFTTPAWAWDDFDARQKVVESTEVLTEIINIPEKEIPPSLLRNCYGIAIIPNVLKAGFVFGGRYGKGLLAVRDSTGNWQSPYFMSLMGGSFGWQIGVQSADIILVFKSRKSVDKIRGGKFTLGLDAAVAAGPVGRQAEVGTDIALKAEIYSYAKSRGLFAGLALEGAVIQIDLESTESFYSAPIYDVEKGGGKIPAEVTRLQQALIKYTSYRK